MKYRLNRAETAPASLIYVPHTEIVNGREIVVTERNKMKLVPNVEYVTDDKATIEFLRSQKAKLRYNEQTIRALESAGVPYEIEYCRSCGGKVKKISYSLIEVYE